MFGRVGIVGIVGISFKKSKDKNNWNISLIYISVYWSWGWIKTNPVLLFVLSMLEWTGVLVLYTIVMRHLLLSPYHGRSQCGFSLERETPHSPWRCIWGYHLTTNAQQTPGLETLYPSTICIFLMTQFQIEGGGLVQGVTKSIINFAESWEP